MPRKSTAGAAKARRTAPATRPRNLLAVAARKRSAGPHGPSRKAERAAAKVRLKKGKEGG